MEKKLVAAAHVVRSEIESFVLDKDPRDFDDVTLQGACGIASLVLVRVLRRLGVQASFVMGYYGDPDNPYNDIDHPNHCWVKLQDRGLLIDVTATQFDVVERVHITSATNTRYTQLYNDRRAVFQLGRWCGQSHVFYTSQLSAIVARATTRVKEICSNDTVDFNEQLVA